MDSISDEGVVATNDYAAVCKYQAVVKGYYKDPYIEKFLSAKSKLSTPRKAPEINRGYRARSTTIAFIVEKFIERYSDAQVLSLGAGYDTLFWRLHDSKLINDADDDNGDINQGCAIADQQQQRRVEAPPGRNVKFVEIDMSLNVVHKIMCIRRHKDLSKVLKGIRFKGEGLHSDNYHLFSYDLRQVNKTPLKQKLIEECQLSLSKPTLCLAECVLVYMPCHDSNDLLEWLQKTFNQNITVVNYEQCNMNDTFGEIMKANMSARNCDLMGAELCDSLSSQLDRFKSTGLIETKGWTLLDILKNRLLPASIERVFSLEFLDEKELLEQLLEHYCVAIGSNKPIDWIPEEEYWLSTTTP